MKCDGNLHGPRLKTLALKNITENSLELERTWTERQFSFILLIVFEFAWQFFCEFEFGEIVKFVAKSLCTIFEYSSIS